MEQYYGTLRLLLDNYVFLVGLMYFSIRFVRYHCIKHSVINTDTVHTAYFNIMWSKTKRGTSL